MGFWFLPWMGRDLRFPVLILLLLCLSSCALKLVSRAPSSVVAKVSLFVSLSSSICIWIFIVIDCTFAFIYGGWFRKLFELVGLMVFVSMPVCTLKHTCELVGKIYLSVDICPKLWRAQRCCENWFSCFLLSHVLPITFCWFPGGWDQEFNAT